jgi:hypothetical protein
MSKRLQVLFDEGELDAIRRVAAQEGMTVSEWVRAVLRRARQERPTGDAARKLAAVRAATRHEFPTGDIDQMLTEIEAGYAR